MIYVNINVVTFLINILVLDKLKRRYPPTETKTEATEPRIRRRPYGMERILQGRKFEDLSLQEQLAIIYSKQGEEWDAAEMALRLANKK